VFAPCISILADTTPSTFFDGISASHVAEGLIPRFTVVQYEGKRPKRNRQANTPPPEALLRRMAELANLVLERPSDKAVDVEMDAQGMALLDAFDEEADGYINTPASDATAQLWTRAHLKALRLSGLLAVGVNFVKPVVTAEVAAWAIDYIRRDVAGMAKRFETGDVGTGEDKGLSDARRVIKEYFDNAEDSVKKYKVDPKMVRGRIIPHDYLCKRLPGLASFKNHRLGATSAIKMVMATLVDTGEVAPMSTLDMEKQFGTRAKAYRAL
jgi:hypothetical protein